MCTVTYIPKDNNTFVLTSNRDEAFGRTTFAPSYYTIEGVKMLYPKDAVAGGSWIGISEKNTMVCLLNGGFINHLKVQDYKMSRGVVVKELLKADDIARAVHDFDYEGIEPFTIIAIDWTATLKATELVWDGKDAHITTLKNAPKIWSSSTLYTSEMKKKRAQWFDNFCEHSDLSAESLLKFHNTAGEGDQQVDLKMNRGALGTVSITQVDKTTQHCVMTYQDFQKEEQHSTNFETVTV